MTHALFGAGMHYGSSRAGYDTRNIYSLAEWDILCKQATTWGMRYVHPKVQEGSLPLWYKVEILTYMKNVAEHHGLLCYPMCYLYGNTFGEMEIEAAQVAQVGSIFNGMVLDMEDPWANRGDWAIKLGQLLRETHGYTGLLLASVYANPLTHGTPIQEINAWADAFLPQAYFSLWTGQSVDAAMALMKPQWKQIADAVWNAEQKALQPIQPIISTGSQVPSAEIEKWIQEVGPQAGYVGFWYDQTHAPYAERVTPLLNELFPGEPPMITQSLSDDILKAIYRKNGNFNFDRRLGICNYWCQLMTEQANLFIGSPETDEQIVSYGGRDFAMITFESGRRIYYDKTSHQIFLV